MSQKTRSDKNSATAAVKGFQGLIEDVQPPEGVELRNEQEMIIWRQFTRVRTREDWRDMDLILLSKIVKMEADIRKHQETLDRSGIIIQNKRGTLVTNPLLNVVDMLERRQMAVIRSMSLTQQHSDPRTINAAAKTASDSKNIMSYLSDDLIAMPVRKN
tara:strand:- start:8838 stop:9314 length:477 start_codon:yes stop_codon:yes gene_type:complete